MKIKILMLALMLAFTGVPAAQAASKTMTKEVAEARAAEISQRLHEIKSMDLSQLSGQQRKDLKSELKTTRQELKQMEPYIYISVGALLLIILILILIL